MPNGLAMAMKAIEMGILRVTPTGEIWRDHEVRGSALRKITPRRAECRLKSGYLGVVVRMNGQQYLALAHRVVWTKLRGPIQPKMDINHLDGTKANNDPTNLEIATRSQNHLHAYRTGLKGPSKTTPKAILAGIRSRAIQLRAKGRTYEQIAAALGCSQTSAFRAVNE